MPGCALPLCYLNFSPLFRKLSSVTFRFVAEEIVFTVTQQKKNISETIQWIKLRNCYVTRDK